MAPLPLEEAPELVDRGLLADTAEEALRLAALDPAAARRLGADVVERARAARAWDAVSAAERALGVAAMNLGELEVSVDHLRRAVTAGRRAGSARRLGEARMSLASALVLRGLPAQASRTIRAARDDLVGLHAARAGVQHAAILQELGRYDDALRALRQSLPALRAEGDAEWAARALSNRSLIHVERRAFRAARTDLEEARRWCDEHGLDLPGAYAEQNLGCLAATRGDVPAALRHFDAAEARYREFGLVEPSLFVDRAKVLLGVRLLAEARATADAAVGAYADQGRDVHVPEALLLLSTVALVQGDHGTARGAADGALDGFRRRGRSRAVVLARYARLQADLVSAPGEVDAARVARVARELQHAGWTVPGLEALVLAGRIALDQGRRTSAHRYLTAASTARSTGPAEVRARAWLAEALLRRAEGRRAGALAALRAGARIVDEHQASLGATELRAHVSAHRGALARLGLQMALEGGDPRRVLEWAERDRASALRVRPARPPDDPELSRDLAQLRSTMAQIDEARDEGMDDARLVQRQVLLERRIRDRSRTAEGRAEAAPGPTRSVDELAGPLGDAALVEFVETEGAVLAITVVQGRTRLHDLTGVDEVRRALAHVPFALNRLARPGRGARGGAAAAAAVLERAGDTLDALLVRPLLAAVGERALVVVPSPALQAVTWSALPSCVARAVTVSPSASLWHKAAVSLRRAPTGSTVCVAGPGLPGGRTEAERVAGLYAGSSLLVDGAASCDEVVRRIDGAERLHLAAHGHVRADNPLFSSVALADGPLTVYEIEGLDAAPRHVVLSACDAGQVQAVTGQEVLGFGAALLALGTSTFVAPVVQVSDAATVPLMEAFHRAVATGATPAAALAHAQAGARSSSDEERAAAAAFVCVGAG